TLSTAELNILDGVTANASEINVLDGITATTTELNYMGGVTSAVQTQLDAMVEKAGDTMTGRLVLIDGSTGTPATGFTSEVGLGIYRSGSQQLAVAVSGAQRLRVSYDGIVVT